MVEIRADEADERGFHRALWMGFMSQVEFCGLEEERGTEFLAYAAL